MDGGGRAALGGHGVGDLGDLGKEEAGRGRKMVETQSTGSSSFLSPGLGQEIQTLMLPKVLPADKWASNRPFLLPAFPTPPILLQSPGDPQLPHSGQASGLGKIMDREVGGLGILGQRFRAGSVC